MIKIELTKEQLKRIQAVLKNDGDEELIRIFKE